MAPLCPICGSGMRKCDPAWVCANAGAYDYECRTPHCWCRGWANHDGSVTITRTVMETVAEIRRRLTPKNEEAAASGDTLTTARAGEPATTPHERSA